MLCSANRGEQVHRDRVMAAGAHDPESAECFPWFPMIPHIDSIIRYAGADCLQQGRQGICLAVMSYRKCRIESDVYEMMKCQTESAGKGSC